jgi:hypothetical protein
MREDKHTCVIYPICLGWSELRKKNMGCKNARKGIVWSRGKMPKWFNK